MRPAVGDRVRVGERVGPEDLPVLADRRLGGIRRRRGNGGANDSEKEEQSSHDVHPGALRARPFCDTIHPMHKRTALSLGLLLLFGLRAGDASAQIDARMFRQPAVSATQIAFVYAGDIWVVPKKGGVAHAPQLAARRGVVPALLAGRLAHRLQRQLRRQHRRLRRARRSAATRSGSPTTRWPTAWSAGTRTASACSSRRAARAAASATTSSTWCRSTAACRRSCRCPTASSARSRPTAQQFAYMPQSQDFRTWKRYRGGWAPDIWLFDLKTFAARNITNERRRTTRSRCGTATRSTSCPTATPNQRNNIWAYDIDDGHGAPGHALQRLRHHLPVDRARRDIVFQAGGRLYLLDLATEKASEVPVQVVTDRSDAASRASQKVGRADRVARRCRRPASARVFEARGDVVHACRPSTAPVVNLTRRSGVAERYPRWSPDGKTLAYWSDRTGEYELTAARRPTAPAPRQSVDDARRRASATRRTGRPTARRSRSSTRRCASASSTSTAKQATEHRPEPAVDLARRPRASFRFTWSPDSRWLAYARPADTAQHAPSSSTTRRTAAAAPGDRRLLQRRGSPTFDPEGKYLFYASDRAFAPVYGSFDNSWTYAEPDAPRRGAAPQGRPLAARRAQRRRGQGRQEVDSEKDKDKAEGKRSREGRRAESREREAGGREGQGRGRKGRKPKPVAGRHRPRRLRGARRRSCRPRPGTTPSSTRDQGQAALPPRCRAPGGRRRQEPGRLLRPRGARGEDGPRRRGRLRGRPPTARSCSSPARQQVRDHRDQAGAEAREADAHRRHARRRSTRAPSGSRCSPTRSASSATTSTTPACTASTGPALRDAYGAAARRRGDALGRELRARRVDRRAERVAHLPRRRRRGAAAPRAASACSASTGSWPTAPTGSSSIVRGGAVGRRRALAAGRARRQREGGRVRAGRERRAARRAHAIPGRRSRGWPTRPVAADGERQPDSRGRAAGGREVPRATRPSCGSAPGSRSGASASTRRPAGRSATSTCRAPASTRRTSWCGSSWRSGRKDGLVIDERFNSGGQIPDRFIELLNRPILSYWAVRDGESQQWPPVAHSRRRR